MILQTIEDRLRYEHQLPDDFAFWSWKCFPPTGDTMYVEFIGGCCPRLSKGKRKGRPNHAKATDRQTFNVSMEQAERWERDYEEDTGNCRECRGEGRVVWRISFKGDGKTDYRTCHVCDGSGKAALDGMAERAEESRLDTLGGKR